MAGDRGTRPWSPASQSWVPLGKLFQKSSVPWSASGVSPEQGGLPPPASAATFVSMSRIRTLPHQRWDRTLKCGTMRFTSCRSFVRFFFHASGKPMKAKLLIPCLALCVALVSSASARPMAQRLGADIRMAEHAILASLAVHKSSESRSLCSQSPYACAGADGAELGLALIGGSRSPSAPKHLLELSRFRMDGALSEDYKCYVASRGGPVIQAAAKLDARKLAAQCRSELEAFQKRAGGNSFDVAPESMCSSAADIQKFLREVGALVKGGNDCDGV
ncbi:Imm57 family immunity protein [Stenotrophomonas lactitubi]|uniref:Imm57 family immunity protein n=2 Tax=Stenotrophomonas TaxID=40323 RepID=UPI003CCE6F2F